MTHLNSLDGRKLHRLAFSDVNINVVRPEIKQDGTNRLIFVTGDNLLDEVFVLALF